MKRQVPDGMKVKFTHLRKVEVNGWKLDDEPVSAKDIVEHDLTMLPRGGLTECRLMIFEGREIVAWAECSDKDNYCKKIGRDIALGRALKHAERNFPELFKVKETA